MDEDGVFYGGDGTPATMSLGEFVLQHLRKHADANRVAQVH